MTETNAKRLDRIKYKTTFIFSADTGGCDGVDLPFEDFNYLIEQAERTQMLTEAAKGSKIILNMETNDRQRLEKENERLREALKFYADKEIYVTGRSELMGRLPSEVEFDDGNIARRALDSPA